MKPLFYFIAVLFIAASCKEEPAVKEKVVTENIKAEIGPEDKFDYDTLQGMYIGDFGGSDIRIILNYISQKNAIGYNIHKGLQRNITGKVTRSGDSVQLVLSEPGDHEFDGVFTINFIGNDMKPEGYWEANSKKIPKKSFKLRKIVQPDKEEYDEVTVTNFARIFDRMRDTIGDYSFNDDGLVILQYYQNETSNSQMKELSGIWSLKGNHVTINWEDNKLFPGNVLELDIVEHEYGERSLKGKGDHEIWMMWPY